MTNLKEIFETRAKEVPEKPFLGSRKRIINEETKEESLGEYEWKTFGEIYKESLALGSYLI